MTSEPIPLLTVDLDGVVCRPFFGRNIGIHRGFLDPVAEPPPARVWPRWIGDPLDRLRFEPRQPLPEAAEALERLARIRRLVALTGRRSLPLGWLRRHRLDGYFEQVVINHGERRSPHYKLEELRTLGAAEHVDDDPRTAQLLAQASEVRVFLRDWPRNRGLDLDPRIVRVPDLLALARLLEDEAR